VWQGQGAAAMCGTANSDTASQRNPKPLVRGNAMMQLFRYLQVASFALPLYCNLMHRNSVAFIATIQQLNSLFAVTLSFLKTHHVLAYASTGILHF
jgi:hypothetical protein